MSGQEGTKVRAMVVINPGNPTGQCLSIENMREVRAAVAARGAAAGRDLPA